MDSAGEWIDNLKVSVYRVPTDFPESDGTLEWENTTLVLVEMQGMGSSGLGYTYSDESAALFIYKKLKPLVLGQHPFNIAKIVQDMSVAIRNEGNCGIAYMAISAVDAALWDLKANILNLPLCDMIGRVHDKALIYGSGGFTSYDNERLQQQLGGWAKHGFTAVKMKIGRQPEKDAERIKAARIAIGGHTKLFIDANGAYTVKQALNFAETFNEYGVSWFEEPVSSDNLDGLRFIRERAPFSMKIAAGEYGYSIGYFKQMLQHGSVDVLQADATRCGGITGFLKAGNLCEAFKMPFSFHCAPALHLHASLCLNAFYIGEYFHDHSRIEDMLFEGAPKPVNGYLQPDLSKPGLGLNFKHQDAKPYQVS